MDSKEFHYEELNGEMVVLDAEAGLVHRITGETAEAVRAERDEMTRRRMIRAAVALGVAAGVSSIALPSAAAAASGGGGGGSDVIGSSYDGSGADESVSAPWLGAGGVSAGVSTVTVNWSGMGTPTSFRVYMSTDGVNFTLAYSGSGNMQAQTFGGDPGYSAGTTIGTLTNGVEYSFFVVAVSSGKVSNRSDIVSETPVPSGVPNKPEFGGMQDSSSIVNGVTTYTVRPSWYWRGWTGSGGPEPTKYRFKYRLSPTGSFSAEAELAPGSGAGGYTFPTEDYTLIRFDYNDTPPPYFEFKVRAVNATGSSGYLAFGYVPFPNYQPG